VSVTGKAVLKCSLNNFDDWVRWPKPEDLRVTDVQIDHVSSRSLESFGRSDDVAYCVVELCSSG